MTRALVVALALVAGCKLDSTYGGTSYKCGVPERCPDGFVCEAGYCVEEPGDGDGGPGGADAAAPPAVGGDLLFLTFDDRNQPLLWDRSGNRHDAHQGGAHAMPGRHGGGLSLDQDDSVFLPDTGSLFAGSAITIEAWIQRNDSGVERGIYGDHAISDDLAAEASLEIDAQDHLIFLTNHNCSPDQGRKATSTGVVPAGEWVHVAVAWDGETARFYLDGEDAGEEALSATPCELSHAYRVARRTGDATSATLAGLIDEVKVSSIAKTQEDIQASMAFDSTAIIGLCGDNIVEMEDCEQGGCCNDDCEASSDGVACGDGAGECTDGSCIAQGGRVTTGLAALWDFQEGTGNVVGDKSGLDPAIDLAISTPGAVSWVAGGLDITGAATIEAAVSTARLATGCSDASEVSLEAWITPQSATAYGKIFFLSDGTGELNIGLMQYGDAFITKIRSDASTTDGLPGIDSAEGDAAVTELTHVVVTRGNDGQRRTYVNSRMRSLNRVRGALGWAERQLAIADQANDNDSWFGTFHLLALYCHELSAAEVAQNYTAGPP